MQLDFDGEADGEVLGVPDADGVPDGESGELLVGVPGEVGLGVGLPLVLGVGEGDAVLPPFPCFA